MNELSSRERLLRSLNKQSVDRMPVSPFIFNNFVKAFYKDSEVDVIKGTIEVYKEFGFDLMHRNFNVRFEEKCLDSKNWKVTTDEKKSGTSKVVTTKIQTPQRELTQIIRFEDLTPYLTVSAAVELFIKEQEDFRQFVKYRPALPKLDLQELKTAKELIGDKGIAAPWFWGGVFNYVSELRKVDDLIMDAMEDSEFFSEMMEYFTGTLIENARQITEEGVDVLSYGGNVANATLVGPKYFMENIFKYEKQIIDFIQDKGTHVLYHNCGDADNMFDVYNKLGFHAYESITEPPFANNSLKDAVDRYDESITLIGNMDQINFLKQATPDEVKAKTIEKLEIIGKRKGFIFGTSDFLEEDTPYENLYALAETVKNYNYGGRI
jgi:uroporphyrinogen decarboxylase